MNRWTTDIEDWTSIEPETANLLISQAESRLKASEETSRILTDSSHRFLAMVVTLISVSLGYVFSGSNDYLQTVSIFVILICIYPFFLLWRNLFNFTIYTVGEEPMQIFTSQFINEQYSGELQYKNLVFQVLETIQSKINANKPINLIRAQRLSIVKKTLLITPLTFLLAFLYLRFLG